MKRDPSPQEIKAELDRYILGQEKAKRAAATLWHSHVVHNVRQNMFFIGPSGCGKTEIFRQLSKLYKKKVYIFDASSITNDGWKGQKKYDSVFSQMFTEDWTASEIEHSIIVYDEFDKLVSPKFTTRGENVAASVQGEMLAVIEGTSLSVRLPDSRSSVTVETIDTSNISFVFLGAFSDLRKSIIEDNSKNAFGFGESRNEIREKPEITIEQIIDYGLTPELAGRISRLVTLDQLTADDYYTILTDPNMSPISKYALMYKCNISADIKALKLLTEKAEKSGMGVRYVSGQILEAISEEMYEPGSSGYLDIIWDDEISTEPSEMIIN